MLCKAYGAAVADQYQGLLKNANPGKKQVERGGNRNGNTRLTTLKPAK